MYGISFLIPLADGEKEKPEWNKKKYFFNCFILHFDLLNLIYTNQCTLLYNNVLVYNVKIKTLKKTENAPTCFDLYSDILKGARSFLVKAIHKHHTYAATLP
jgi:hypothetical protein